jgi:hypothetical protein
MTYGNDQNDAGDRSVATRMCFIFGVITVEGMGMSAPLSDAIYFARITNCGFSCFGQNPNAVSERCTPSSD